MNIRIVVICLLFACLTAAECFSQREFRFGTKGGVIYQKRYGDSKYNHFAVGINRLKVYDNNLFFEFGLGYQQLHQFKNNKETGYYKWEQALGINIPLALGYKYKNHLFSFDLNIFGYIVTQYYSYNKLTNTNFRAETIKFGYPRPFPIPLLSYQYKINESFYGKISTFHIPQKYELNNTIIELGINYTFDTKTNDKKK